MFPMFAVVGHSNYANREAVSWSVYTGCDQRHVGFHITMLLPSHITFLLRGRLCLLGLSSSFVCCGFSCRRFLIVLEGMRNDHVRISVNDVAVFRAEDVIVWAGNLSADILAIRQRRLGQRRG